LLAWVSPYRTEHINGFGNSVPNMHRRPPQPANDFTLRVRSAATSEIWLTFRCIVATPHDKTDVIGTGLAKQEIPRGGNRS
jgi:hypothetical protein